MKMKSYTITVNGNVYDVTVEEKTAGFTPAQSPAPAPAPAAPHAPAQPAPAASSAGPAGTGRIVVKAGAAGKVQGRSGKAQSEDPGTLPQGGRQPAGRLPADDHLHGDPLCHVLCAAHVRQRAVGGAVPHLLP